ncbi:insulinase family protein [Candidatus Woesearchaeota archaeon]|nr:insulinase family protein [Candidatus Woesearchaeota archaeon]
MKYHLDNGLIVIEKWMPSDTVTVHLTVKTGSNNECEGIRGISHFIEHMVFEGTKKRSNAMIIGNEIESIGGDINAYTDNVRTAYHVKVPKKHFEKSMDILSDIIRDPIFLQKHIDKERRVILKEINMFNDEARLHQWMMFQSQLFRKHPAKYPVLGKEENVMNMTRDDLIGYYKEKYTAKNSILSIVGNFHDSKKIVKNYFDGYVTGKPVKQIYFHEPENKIRYVIKEKRKLMNSYMVIGFKTVSRLHHDSFVLDVIQAILGRGQSGRIFDEIRGKRGLSYEVNVIHESSTDFGFFAVGLGAEKSKLKAIRSIILREFNSLQSISTRDIREAIGYIEGRHVLEHEDTCNLADYLAYWEMLGSYTLGKEYIKRIKSVTKKDIARVSRKYFNDKYTMALIEQR